MYLYHPNIIKMYGFFDDANYIYIILEVGTGGQLYHQLKKSEPMTEVKVAGIMKQVCEAVNEIHSLKIIHRDIKPENLLLDKDHKTLKIVDFGLSNIYQDTQGNEIMLETACGSPCYAAPEMVQALPYQGFTVDIWSSGVTLYAMICGYLPFEEAQTALLYQKIIKGYYEIPSFLSFDAIRMIKGLLNVDPKERLTFEKIRKEPWI